MASSSDPIASLDAPGFRPSPSSSVDPSWLLPRGAEALTRSLLRSLTEPETPSVFFFDPESTAPPSASASASASATAAAAAAAAASSFDPEAAARKRPRTAGPSRKKRKSRSSNRSQTTFIAADAANFRRMVQQVTGVKFGGTHAFAPPVTKPEPQQRAGCRFPVGGGLLPNLDASSSLLVGGVGGGGPEGPLCFPAPAAAAPGAVAEVGGAGGLGFDSFACFPTLDSWKLI